jgi:hypothetical protein
MRALAYLCLLAVGSAGTRAQDFQADAVRVVSARPDTVSVTIYRDLFALVTETRIVDLPAGQVTLVFDGVVESLLPQSAVVTGTGRALRESNYDYQVLSPETLLTKAIGREVLLTRTNPATGRVHQLPARLVAANRGGVVFQTLDGNEALHCSGLPEQLSFAEIPGELSASPALSVRLDAGNPGKREVRVSYLAYGFGWSADYVGTLAASADRMDLHGWITLHNLTQAEFHGAQVQVVAGRLNLLDSEESRGTSLIGDTAGFSTEEELDTARVEALEEAREDPTFLADLLEQGIERFSGCYPHGAGDEFDLIIEPTSILGLHREAETVMDSMEVDEIIVTGFRMSMAVRENLADYQMYRLPGPTDLAPRQTKQVAFLRKPEVRVEKFYGLRLDENFGDDDVAAEENFIPIGVNVGWRNRESDGLGEPLPGGVVRFFEGGATGMKFVGADQLKDTPAGTPVELTIGRSVDVGITFDGSGDEPVSTPMSRLTRRFYLPLHLRVYNDKPRPVLVEIRQAPLPEFQDLRVIDASVPPKRKAGDYLWRFEVPARGEKTLSYKVGGRVPD